MADLIIRITLSLHTPTKPYFDKMNINTMASFAVPTKGLIRNTTREEEWCYQLLPLSSDGILPFQENFFSTRCSQKNCSYSKSKRRSNRPSWAKLILLECWHQTAYRPSSEGRPEPWGNACSYWPGDPNSPPELQCGTVFPPHPSGFKICFL